MNWKAIIEKRSNVDAAGMAEFTYDIYVDRDKKYPNQTVRTKPESVVEQIRAKVEELKNANEKSEELVLPLEIEI